MLRRVLDTNVLSWISAAFNPTPQRGPQDARDRARLLIKDKNTDAILSAIEVEFLVGVVDRHEMELAEAYLAEFQVIDENNTLPQDWEEARRVARHIGHHATPRDLGDCLIIAICERLHYDCPLPVTVGSSANMGERRQRRP